MSLRSVTLEDLDWIVCPVCHQPLQLEGDMVVCPGCARRYPIVDGIPVMLTNRAL